MSVRAPDDGTKHLGAYAADVRVGAKVEVRNRFDGRWSHGFVVTEVVPTDDDPDGPPGVRVARRSDGSPIPTVFTASEVREERRRQTWWQ